MEPLSTMVLLASLATATVIPSFNPERQKKHKHIETSISLYDGAGIEESTVADFTKHSTKKTSVVSFTNDTVTQLDVYSELEHGWDGPDSVPPSQADIDLAKKFVNSVPAVFPLPKAMLSSDGTVGLYWNDAHIYIDIQFESDHTLSMFSRNRSSDKERFFDSIDVSSIDSNWFFNTLEELLSQTEDALAA